VKKQDKEKELLNEMVDAWESLEGDMKHTAKTVEKWLIFNMKPTVDKARDFLGRTSKKMNERINNGQAKTNRKK